MRRVIVDSDLVCDRERFNHRVFAFVDEVHGVDPRLKQRRVTICHDSREVVGLRLSNQNLISRLQHQCRCGGVVR